MDIDNIADPMSLDPVTDIPVHDAPPAIGAAVSADVVDSSEEYLKRFDIVTAANVQIVAAVAEFASQPDDQHRLYAAMECMKLQQRLNEELIDLLVEMHNFFGSK